MKTINRLQSTLNIITFACVQYPLLEQNTASLAVVLRKIAFTRSYITVEDTNLRPDKSVFFYQKQRSRVIIIYMENSEIPVGMVCIIPGIWSISEIMGCW